MPVRIVKDEPDDLISNVLNDNSSSSENSGLSGGLIGGLIGLGVLAVGACIGLATKKKKQKQNQNIAQSQMPNKNMTNQKVTSNLSDTNQTKYHNMPVNKNLETKSSVNEPLLSTEELLNKVNPNINNPILNQSAPPQVKKEINIQEYLNPQNQQDSNIQQYLNPQQNTPPLPQQHQITPPPVQQVIQQQQIQQQMQEPVIEQQNVIQNQVSANEQIQEVVVESKEETIKQAEDVLQDRFAAAKHVVSLWGYTCGADKNFPPEEAKAFEALLKQMIQQLFPAETTNQIEVETELKQFFYKPVSFAEIVLFCKPFPEFSVKVFEQLCYLVKADYSFSEEEKKILNRFASETGLNSSETLMIMSKYQLKVY